MGKLRSFYIEFDNPQGVFQSGKSVIGRLAVHLDAEMNMKEIRLKFKGAAYALWTETIYIGTGSNSRRETIYHSAHETYFDTRVPVFGKGVGTGSKNSLPPGEHYFPFTFHLPPDLPSSFEGEVGYVRYTIKGTIDKPWKFDHDTKRPFTVTSLLDLNTYPNATKGVDNLDEKFLCCLCCKSGPISGSIRLERSGYVPGEKIPFNAEIQNMTNKRCSVSVMFNMKTIFRATRSTYYASAEISRINHEAVLPGETENWFSDEIKVPPLPPSFLLGCSIIDVDYCLKLVINPSGMGSSLNIPVSIIIGTKPLNCVVEQYETQHRVPIQELVKATERATFISENSLPPPSFRESVFGKANIREEEDSKHTRGEMEYAPAYTYYDWSNQSQFNLKI